MFLHYMYIPKHKEKRGLLSSYKIKRYPKMICLHFLKQLTENDTLNI